MIEDVYTPGRKGKIGYQYRINTGLCPGRMEPGTYGPLISEMTKWCHLNTVEPDEVTSGKFEKWNCRLIKWKEAPKLPTRSMQYTTHFMYFLFNDFALATMFMLRFKRNFR